MFSATQPRKGNRVIEAFWSGRWESNPRPKLGKLLYCHCTTPALVIKLANGSGGPQGASESDVPFSGAQDRDMRRPTARTDLGREVLMRSRKTTIFGVVILGLGLGIALASRGA